MTTDPRVPVTILTGFLGAGKTTLVNRILAGSHGRRYAVVVNEFGAVGIDGALIVAADDTVVEMSNGCLCCAVRGDLAAALHDLLGRAQRFDGLIVETSGLADPGPIAQTFLADPFLLAATRVDAIVTLVDAANVVARLADSVEAATQIALADVIVLNKCELATPPALADIETRIHILNPTAPITRATRGEVPLDRILGRAAFDLERFADLTPSENPPHGSAGHIHTAACDHAKHSDHQDHDRGPDHVHAPQLAPDHVHSSGIASVSLLSDQPFHPACLSAWLEQLISNRAADIWRAKGIIDIAGDDRRFVFQSVGTLIEGDFQAAWPPGPRHSRLVLIGRHLDEAALGTAFAACSMDQPTA
jgi:G3E family GTPase